MKKVVIVILGILILAVIAGIFVFNKPKQTGTVVENVEVVPLSEVERQAVIKTVSETEFVKDIQEDEPIAIVFYDFDTGERRFRDGFLINNKGFLQDGAPTIYIYLHSKYIQELEQKDLCSIINEAIQNGDLTTNSEYSNARLLLKYAGMLKHRACAGF